MTPNATIQEDGPAAAPPLLLEVRVRLGRPISLVPWGNVIGELPV